MKTGYLESRAESTCFLFLSELSLWIFHPSKLTHLGFCRVEKKKEMSWKSHYMCPWGAGGKQPVVVDDAKQRAPRASVKAANISSVGRYPALFTHNLPVRLINDSGSNFILLSSWQTSKKKHWNQIFWCIQNQFYIELLHHKPKSNWITRWFDIYSPIFSLLRLSFCCTCLPY